MSGVVSPRGTVSSQLLTSGDEVALFSLPLWPHITTPYAAGGWALEYLNILLAVAAWAYLACWGVGCVGSACWGARSVVGRGGGGGAGAVGGGGGA